MYMKFITDKELKYRFSNENIKEITQDACGIQVIDLVEDMEDRAIDMIKNYTRSRYDIDFELRAYNTTYYPDSTSGIVEVCDINNANTTCVLNDQERILIAPDEVKVWDKASGLFLKDDRSITLRSMVLDVLIYELSQRVSPRQMNQITVDRYDRTVDMLEKATKGYISLDLRKKNDTANKNVYKPVQFGSIENSKTNDY